MLGVIIAGTAALLDSGWMLWVHPVSPQWVLLALLTLLSGKFTVKLPKIPATISVSDFFIFTSILLFGGAPGTLTVALDGLVISFWRNRSLSRAIFNMSAGASSIWVASHVLFWLAGIPAPLTQLGGSGQLLLPLGGFALTYFVLNSSLVALAVALEQSVSALYVWRIHFPWLCLNAFAGSSIAGLLVSNMREVDLAAFGIILPLFIVSYLTFKTAVARIEDSNGHLDALNKLYLSTIETLAMAIDAKDQITHGHIRRVQQYATGLARAMGIVDERQIKAIEAAALLHDMGKLAVPEHILNKPGKLTPAEFEKMKLHASVGADILAAIEFPYPVVPIVRHHHENWDGHGYPTGLSGTDIPIGARILSVVDCFDALTSDRPYRPKLSNEVAIGILMERRGVMYDPLIVDTFVQVHESLTPVEAEPKPQPQALFEITRSTRLPTELEQPRSVDDNSAGTDEMLTLYHLTQGLAGNATLADAGDVIAKSLMRLVPTSLCVFYVYETHLDQLVAQHAVGADASLVQGLRIDRGDGLSGWVAANRQMIVNSDPILDFGSERIQRFAKRPLSCLSIAMVVNDHLEGVLSLYADAPNAFSEDDRRTVEVVAKQVGQAVQKAREFESLKQRSLRDSVSGLPTLDYLKRFVPADASIVEHFTDPLTVLFVELDSFGVEGANNQRIADHVAANVVTALRRGLRGGDLLFQYGPGEYVILLTKTDAATGAAIASRVCDGLSSAPFVHGGDPFSELVVSSGAATASGDGRSLDQLVSVARRRLSRRILPAYAGQLPTSIH